jgi:hypothetical protein
MSKPIIISDPFPRTLDLIFKKKIFLQIKSRVLGKGSEIIIGFDI